MVSFQELHEANFSGIVDTAEAWSGLAKALEGLDTRVGNELTNTPQRAGWEGASADDAKNTLNRVDQDFTLAAAVARSVAAIVADAADDLKAARRTLDQTLDDAAAQKLTVAANGDISWPPMQGVPHNDPDSQQVSEDYRKEMKGKADAVSDRINRAVDQATAADQRAAAALQTDVGSSTTSFNSAPYGGGDAADAKRAADLMSKGGSLSDDELKRLQNLMAANAGSKDFSTTLLNSLNAGGKNGPEALLEYSKIYGDLGRGDHNGKQYQDVYGNLSQVLATATKDGGMGKDWQDGLLKAAREGSHGSSSPYNTSYDVLTDLMGAKGDFDKEFLNKVGTDLIDYERGSKAKGEDLWGPGYTAVTGNQGDPMGGLMQAMSRNPEAAKGFFDPEGNKNLDYLLKDRDWPNKGYEEKQLDSIARGTSRGTFGDALEAATTGRDPHGNQPPVHPHDPAMARIMSNTVATLGGERAGDENKLPAGLRHPLGNMIADYAPDTHEILGKEMGGESETSKLTVTRDQLLRTIRGVSEDPEAYKTIHYAETREIARRMDTYGPEAMQPDGTGRPNPKFAGFVQESGQALGSLDGVRSDVITDHRDDQIFRNNWNSKINYHILGTPANIIFGPAGDLAQRLVDVGTADYANKLNDEASSVATGKLSDTFSAGDQELGAMIRQKAAQSGLSQDQIKATGGVPQSLMDEATTNYSTAIDRTYRSALGRS
ncbi:hypothetical protein OG689_34970 [Kitasatospora sp. NBC_00240]|uniref:DUF6571 family protein n=1 Tax=Kitasatospora sp. NBC_00240 TaxID=2903567 RepID=UPI002255E6C9|nr:DUF6571 family protein [Kitasatospora sp. NBC_00240]MCX5214405.1 hypothetical protein [Kitasatospora sp. NBC_00240]